MSKRIVGECESMDEFEVHKKRLDNLLFQLTKDDCAVAFSGGVDSSLVLKLACENAKKNHTKVYAVTANTSLHPAEDVKIASQVAKEEGAIHLILNLDELKAAGVKENPVNRCYLCKKFIMSKVKELVLEYDVNTILEGSNIDDLNGYRPGIKAVKELGLRSPLMESKMTKTEVRKLAKAYQITVADRPSAPCLATRFPYGTLLSYEEMHKVEQAELYLRSFEIYNVRLRVYGDLVRIEVDENSINIVVRHRQEIIEVLKKIGYEFITLDLEGFRSGSMDYNLDNYVSTTL